MPSELQNLLAEAVRYNDARAEEHGFEGVIKQIFGNDVDAVMHVAQQRAMRYVLVTEGREINEQNMRSVLTHPARKAMMISLIPTFLDGLCAGWEAKTIKDRAEQ